MPKHSRKPRKRNDGSARPLSRWLGLVTVLAVVIFGGSAHAVSSNEIQAQVLSAIDPSVNPCDDFYRYACGRWIDSIALPEDADSVMRGFSTAEDNIRARLAVLLQDAANNPFGDPDRHLAGTYFSACLNAAGADNGQPNPAAIAAFQPYFDLIDTVSDTSDLLNVAGRLATLGVPAVFRISLRPNIFSLLPPRNYIILLNPADPGFYDPDVYLQSDARNRTLRQNLQKIIRNDLRRFGETVDVDRHVRDILRLETLLVRYLSGLGKPPDVVLTPPASLYSASRHQDWRLYFQGAGNIQGDQLLYDRQFIKALGNALNKFPVGSLRSYLRWKLIRTYRFALPSYYREYPPLSPTFEAIFSAGPSPAWKRCVDDTSTVLAETTGKLWVGSQNTDRLRALTASMMAQVQAGFISRLPALPWLDSLSAIATEDKAINVDQQLGFPAYWIDETGLSLSRGDYLGNTIAATAGGFRRMAARVGQPIDRTLWDRDVIGFYPQTVNAAYYRFANQIYVPLGVQQEPIAHPDYPLAMNFGALGTVLGHEFTHGFDDGGHYFDSLGLPGNIWDRDSTRAFNKMNKCLIRQYGNYQIAPPPRKLEGRAILTENLADNGGIRLSFNAFQASLPLPVSYPSGIGPLTHGQLFFVAFAQTFCEKITPAYQRYLISRTWYRYAPNQYRVIGSLSNSSEFAAAFSCPVGSPMNPAQKCEVW